MPIYEYSCTKCNKKFELMRSLSRSTEGASCPKCENRAERIMSGCYSMSRSEGGVARTVAGSGSSCASCGSGSCGTCHNN
jgi:putative FmdB family regulatory protein